MLEQLFGSKTRFKLLQFFIFHPNNHYFVRELTRLMKTQINSIRRELSILEDINLIKSFAPDVNLEKVKKTGALRKYYGYNVDFLMGPELRSLLLKEKLLLQEGLIKTLKKLPGVQLLVLTGMFIGYTKEEIPTDVLLVGSVDDQKLKQIISQLEKDFGQEINYTALSYKEYQYRRSIRDRFLLSILDGRKLVLLDQLIVNEKEK